MVLDEQRSTSNERTENAGSFGDAPADSRQKPIYGTPAYDIPPLQPESGVPVDPPLSSDATDPASLGTDIVNESGSDAWSSAASGASPASAYRRLWKLCGTAAPIPASLSAAAKSAALSTRDCGLFGRRVFASARLHASGSDFASLA